MTKRARATTGEDAVVLDTLVVEYLRHERSPADAGKEAGVEVFEGLGASIVAFVNQRLSHQTCAE